MIQWLPLTPTVLSTPSGAEHKLVIPSSWFHCPLTPHGAASRREEAWMFAFPICTCGPNFVIATGSLEAAQYLPVPVLRSQHCFHYRVAHLRCPSHPIRFLLSHTPKRGGLSSGGNLLDERRSVDGRWRFWKLATVKPRTPPPTFRNRRLQEMCRRLPRPGPMCRVNLLTQFSQQQQPANTTILCAIPVGRRSNDGTVLFFPESNRWIDTACPCCRHETRNDPDRDEKRRCGCEGEEIS